MRFSERVVLVTGAGSGIGAATAARFAAEGATAVIADIDGDAATAVAHAIPGAVAVPLDVRSREQVVEDRLGRVDVLVNNAMTCSESSLLELSQADLERDIAVGLTAAVFMVQAVLPGMIRCGGGVVLNMTSVNGFTYLGNDGYSAAKAGLISLTKSIAVRYGRQGIRCNAVAPGTIATPSWEHRVAADPEVFAKASKWYPLGRVGQPDDVASALLFLASDDASWITGATLPVDGGLLAGNLMMADEITPSAADT
jgi:NAD(P)-dependent dehydrogenase (short-subunit alcohol dehydrogenase family)